MYHMYLTLLDKKGGLPVIFCSKRSKDNGRGGKFTKSKVGIHHHDHQLLYLLNTAQVRYVVLKRGRVCPN